MTWGDIGAPWVADGRMARRAVRDTRYDALILDLGLPGVGGREVLAELRAADQRLPILILTARDSLMERVGNLTEGADDFSPSRSSSPNWRLGWSR
jgi:two-component system response regulator TctD